MGSLILAALAASVLALGPAATAAPAAAAPAAVAASQNEVTLAAIVEKGGQADGRIWFKVLGVDAHFVARQDGLADEPAFWKALSDSASTNRFVTVSFDAAGGRFEAGDDDPTFTVRRLSYGGADIAGDGSAATLATGDAAATAKARLAEAIGRLEGDQTREAMAGVTAALASGALDAKLQTRALKLRASVEASQATDDYPPGPERDRLLLAALNDIRAWGKLAPDDTKAVTNEAAVLTGLGAYAEALALYDRLTRLDDQNEIHWALIRQAAIYRTLGDNDRALAVLDDIKLRVADYGMAYYYHRGTTLTALGRYKEAVEAFDQGFESQPDFSGAFQRRACALGKLGRVKEALADLKQSAKLDNEWASRATVIVTRVRFDFARREALIATLEPLAAKGDKTPVDVCGGFWDYGETRRERSPLLPPQPAG